MESLRDSTFKIKLFDNKKKEVDPILFVSMPPIYPVTEAVRSSPKQVDEFGVELFPFEYLIRSNTNFLTAVCNRYLSKKKEPLLLQQLNFRHWVKNRIPIVVKGLTIPKITVEEYLLRHNHQWTPQKIKNYREAI